MMRRLNDLSTASTSSQMSDLTAEIVKTNSIQLLLQEYDFQNEKEVAQSIRRCYECIIADAFLRSDEVRKNNPILLSFYNRYKKHYTTIAFEGYCENTAKHMWLSFFAKKKRDEQLQQLINSTPQRELYEQSCERLKAIYNFTDEDITKLKLFCVQAIKGRSFPDSLRRMLYLYSETKKTGKTTFARILAEVLNGWQSYEDSNIFNSQLSIEMQIQNYSVPKAAQYNCVVLDECFYTDMQKTYSRFKEIITSRDGEGRLPYGQPFKWEGVRNYIATSNENLSTFIADWSDRRYYNIDFKGIPEQVVEQELFNIVSQFVTNINTDNYINEININYNELEVSGTKTINCNDYMIEMQQDVFTKWLLDMNCDCDKKFAIVNRLTTKKIVEFFASQRGSNAMNQRKEIERAFTEVYGNKYNGQYWLLPDIKKKIKELNNEDAVIEQVRLPF